MAMETHIRDLTPRTVLSGELTMLRMRPNNCKRFKNPTYSKIGSALSEADESEQLQGIRAS